MFLINKFKYIFNDKRNYIMAALSPASPSTPTTLTAPAAPLDTVPPFKFTGIPRTLQVEVISCLGYWEAGKNRTVCKNFKSLTYDHSFEMNMARQAGLSHPTILPEKFELEKHFRELYNRILPIIMPLISDYDRKKIPPSTGNTLQDFSNLNKVLGSTISFDFSYLFAKRHSLSGGYSTFKILQTLTLFCIKLGISEVFNELFKSGLELSTPIIHAPFCLRAHFREDDGLRKLQDIQERIVTHVEEHHRTGTLNRRGIFGEDFFPYHFTINAHFASLMGRLAAIKITLSPGLFASIKNEERCHSTRTRHIPIEKVEILLKLFPNRLSREDLKALFNWDEELTHPEVRHLNYQRDVCVLYAKYAPKERSIYDFELLEVALNSCFNTRRIYPTTNEEHYTFIQHISSNIPNMDISSKTLPPALCAEILKSTPEIFNLVVSTLNLKTSDLWSNETFTLLFPNIKYDSDFYFLSQALLKIDFSKLTIDRVIYETFINNIHKVSERSLFQKFSDSFEKAVFRSDFTFLENFLEKNLVHDFENGYRGFINLRKKQCQFIIDEMRRSVGANPTEKTIILLFIYAKSDFDPLTVEWLKKHCGDRDYSFEAWAAKVITFCLEKRIFRNYLDTPYQATIDHFAKSLKRLAGRYPDDLKALMERHPPIESRIQACK